MVSRFLPLVLLFLVADCVWADTSFLAQPFPEVELNGSSVAKRLKEIQAILHKSIVAPDGVVDFTNEREKWRVGPSLTMGPWGKADTIRSALTTIFAAVDLSWSYDEKRDRVVLDFLWKRDDPRNSEQLLKVLENTKPLPLGSPFSKNASFFSSTSGKLADSETWRIAFDALLSKPDNLSKAWKVRLTDDLGSSLLLPSPVRNVWAGKVRDNRGLEHFLVINNQPLVCTPGEGSLTYYVFDLHGQFEQGGSITAGWRSAVDKISIDSSETKVTLEVLFNFKDEIDQTWQLNEEGLKFVSAQQMVNGSMQEIKNPLVNTGYHLGIVLFHTGSPQKTERIVR